MSKVQKRIFTAAAAFTVALVLPLTALMFPVYALEEQPMSIEEVKKQEAIRQKAESARQKKEAVQSNLAEKREAAKTKLAEAKLQACHNREKAISNIMARMSDRGEKHLAVFTKISERVQDFYEEKNLSFNSYESLVADVDAKKAAAEAAVEVVKDSSVEFKCDGSDPKGAASHFLEKRKDMHEALKAYKTAVKNLTVGVKTAIGEQEGEQQ